MIGNKKVENHDDNNDVTEFSSKANPVKGNEMSGNDILNTDDKNLAPFDEKDDRR